MTTPKTVDYVVIGGGFYGCCLALFLRSVSPSVTLVEAGDTIMTRASRINQARLHSGFHYPRSMMTALKSQKLCHRFALDFPDAILSDFQMLYAIARHRSKISAGRFRKMFDNMRATISPATPGEEALFDDSRIEAVFRVQEHAFDYSVLANLLGARLAENDIDVRLSTKVLRIGDDLSASHAVVHLCDGSEILAKQVFNVTYSQMNHLLQNSKLPLAHLKHEVTELVLIEPPEEVRNYAVTVMDGHFFSLMPYPAARKYSLTHVKYTPHMSWIDQLMPISPYEALEIVPKESRAKHMILDAARYMPCIGRVRGEHSIFGVKTVLAKNENDDGRPILIHEQPSGGRVTSVLGSKIDNIYDLFSHLRQNHPALGAANTNLMIS